MIKNGLVSIQFTKWVKWQGRSDVKRPWWFKFSNKFFTGSDLQILTKDEKYLFAIMLCEASNQNNNGKLVLPIKFLETWGECSKNIVFSTLKKLNEIEILTEICTESVRNLDEICTESVRQTKTKTKNKKNNIAFLQTPFDFELVFKKYPKRLNQNKKKGITLLTNEIKNKQDYCALTQAVINYNTYVTQNKIEQKYIKQFATFAKQWQEWVNIEQENKKIDLGGVND